MDMMKHVVVALLSVFYSFLAIVIYNEISYSRIMPNAPDVSSGQIHRMAVNHGHVIYVNESQLRHRQFIQIAGMVGVAAFGAAVFLNVKYKVFGK